MQGDVETYEGEGQWHNRVRGDLEASSSHPTKEEAVARRQQMAMVRKAEHIIRSQDGTVARRSDYSHDPRDVAT
jgi:hypothetical protein